jgi:ketosteroid isomerase-like protein
MLVRAASAFVLVTLMAGGTALASTGTDIESIVRDRIAAAARGDKSAWRKHIADDCVWTGPGHVNATTADAEIAITANASLPQQAAEIRDFEVHEFGDTVLASYVFTTAAAADGGASKRFRKTDTYVRRDGDWRLISAVEIFALPQAVAEVDPSTFDAYAGRHRLDATHIVRVWRDGSKLLSQADGEAKATELLPSARDSFFVDGDIGEYVFGRGHDGVVDRMLFRMDGSPDITLQRIDTP